MSDSFSTRQRAISLGNLAALPLKPERELLGKLILARSIGMLYGPRGSGKSLLAMLLAYAIAAGKAVPPWGTGESVVIAYLDGEMRIRGFKERISALMRFDSKSGSRERGSTNFFIISRDLAGHPIGHIDTEEGQQAIEQSLPEGVSFLVVDNLSAWTEGGGEGTSWQMIKQWLIAMRLRGIAVLLLHHAGKNGAQRGTSAHEDLLDYSIRVSPVPDPDSSVTIFDIEHTKLRDHLPHLRGSFQFRLWSEDGMLRFESEALGSRGDELLEKIRSIRAANPSITQAQLAQVCGKHKSTISRALKELAREEAAAAPESEA